MNHVLYDGITDKRMYKKAEIERTDHFRKNVWTKIKI